MDSRASRANRAILRRIVMIVNQRGLHARAAARFVKLAAGFSANITVAKNGTEVSGLSIMGLMMLAAGVIEVERARIGPRARLLDLISWLPDQEVEAVLAFAEFRGERARSAMRSARIVTNEDTGVDGGSTMASREVGGS